MDESAATDHRRALRTGLISVAFYVAAALVVALLNGGKAEWFVKFGEAGVETDIGHAILGPDIATPYDESQDGTRFWLLARDPFLSDSTLLDRGLDRPSYRAQRILYPLAAAPFRLGGEQSLLWGLVLVNLGVVFLGGYYTARLAAELRAPPRAGYAFALNPVVLLAFVQDLSDAAAVAMVVAMIFAVRRGRWGWAVAAATLAVLAKEPSLLAVAAVAVFANGSVRRRVALLGVPILAAGAWAVLLRARLGSGRVAIDEFTWIPFSSFVDSYRFGWSATGRYGEMVVALGLVVIGIVVLVRFYRRRTLELAACVPYVLFLPFYSPQVIYRAINSVRSIGPIITLLALDLYARRRTTRRALVGSTRQPAAT